MLSLVHTLRTRAAPEAQSIRGRIDQKAHSAIGLSHCQRGLAGTRNRVVSSAYGREERLPRVMLTARVTDTQAAALKSYAADVGLPLYQATVRALELGIAALVGGRGAEPVKHAPAASVSAGEVEALRDAVGRLTVRAELTDRLTQRTLYAAGAAYAAALAGPGQGEEHMAQVARDAERIFDRQLAKARE